MSLRFGTLILGQEYGDVISFWASLCSLFPPPALCPHRQTVRRPRSSHSTDTSTAASLLVTAQCWLREWNRRAERVVCRMGGTGEGPSARAAPHRGSASNSPLVLASASH